MTTILSAKVQPAVEPLAELTRRAIDSAPTAALFVAVVIGGLLGAALLSRAARWLAREAGLDAVGERVGTDKALAAVGVEHPLSTVLGAVVWGACGLLTVAAATEVLGLTAVTAAVGRVVAYLPQLLAGVVVVVGGTALASVLRTVVRRLSRRSGEVDSPTTVSSLVYYMVLTVSVLLAADQVGLETDLADGLVLICVAIGLAAVALSFALGSTDAFRNIVAGHYLRRLVHPGDEIEIEGERGVVLRFSPVAVVLRTGRGQKIVPTRSLLDGTIEVVSSAAAVPPSSEPERSPTE